MAAEAIDYRARRQPEDQGAGIRDAAKGREENRNLRRIKRQIAYACGRWNALRSELGLRIHVVEIDAVAGRGERAEDVEVHEVGAFEVAGTIEQAGRGHVPEIGGPEAQRE